MTEDSIQGTIIAHGEILAACLEHQRALQCGESGIVETEQREKEEIQPVDEFDS